MGFLYYLYNCAKIHITKRKIYWKWDKEGFTPLSQMRIYETTAHKIIFDVSMLFAIHFYHIIIIARQKEE